MAKKGLGYTEMGWLSLQVFETEERKELKNGWLLPLVARIDSGPGPGISIEYCMGAGKYLGFDAKMTPTHSPKMRLGVRNF